MISGGVGRPLRLALRKGESDSLRGRDGVSASDNLHLHKARRVRSAGVKLRDHPNLDDPT